MKKKILVLLLALIMIIGLVSCGPEKQHYDVSEYVLELPYTSDFRILQLSDIHLANKDNRQLHYDFLDLTISEADADLIVITGDTFTFADKRTAKEFFKFMDSYGVPWTITFGNHDEQCYFSIDWLTNLLNNYGGNCVFKDLQDDDVFGNANFAINLTEGGKTKAQVIIIDSNRYNYGEYIGYDYIKPDQVEWYKNLVDCTTKENGGEPVTSVAYFHIPFPEYSDAWEEAQTGANGTVLEYGELNEGCSVPKINTGIFDAMLEKGSTKLVSTGHDHVNDFRILYKGIYLCYGIDSTDRIYFKEDMLGGSVVILHDDGTFGFEQIFHTYEEVM